MWWNPLARPSLRRSGSAEVRQYAALCNKRLSLPCLRELELGILRPPRAGSPGASISEEFPYEIFIADRERRRATEDCPSGLDVMLMRIEDYMILGKFWFYSLYFLFGVY